MSTDLTGLILTGGGARAAYQVGVLQAFAAIRRSCGITSGNPFPVIAGTSAGAINAAGLACRSDDFDHAIDTMVGIWSNIHAEDIYRADSFGVIRAGARWLSLFSMGWALARWRRMRPRSLLDNAPMHHTLSKLVPLERLPRVFAEGHMHALAISASSYTTGEHITFYETSHDIPPWERTQRHAVRDRITHAHLQASSAIPFVFPAVALPIDQQRHYFGDGSMRQAAPISPAIHLGAKKVLVIGAGRMHEPPPSERKLHHEYPNLAQIAGHALSNIFLDALAVDVERLQRINRTVSLLPPEVRAQSSLKPIEVLVIAPSQRLDDIAGRNLGALPHSIRAMLRAVGVYGRGETARGAAFASYLLFEKAYTHELMTLGYADTMARHDDVVRFMGWPKPAPAKQLTPVAETQL
ncbi:patatin-like phospholipase family protein [Aquabacterium sp.]|uniref:patatin-like phospholipase family protein n=1 Tax=Aquabacterium sp. TaxID=1872578 RepID=UPI0035ADD438